MNVNKAYKFRIYPKREQREHLQRHFGHCRFVYNHFLFLRKNTWQEEKRSVSGFGCKRLLSEMKKEDYEWLKEVNSQSLQESCMNLEKGFQRFFKGLGRYPRFHKKGERQSFIVPQHFYIDEENGYIKIPKFSDPIMCLFHRKMGDIKKINHLIISKTSTGKYFVSINVDAEIIVTGMPKREGVGIDLGVQDFLVTHDGEKVEAPRNLRKSLRKLKRKQRGLSKRVKGSKNRAKAREVVAKEHERVRHKRNDFLHKLSRRLVDENQVIYIEDLGVKGMMRNRHLSLSIGDAGWGEFARQLKYKAEWCGGRIVEIGRFSPSSKLCSSCGKKNEGLKLSQRDWICPHCHVEHDRDVNAARNIFYIGQGMPQSTPVEKRTAVFSYLRRQVASKKQESRAS
ncbi:MAG TPA: RNA-guided endonuclease TnpB family protein [Bdellovibrionota bacterium]|nr:RNA-guided endonuclease TnpB family protein [Bdellovibrionota bacterium]